MMQSPFGYMSGLGGFSGGNGAGQSLQNNPFAQLMQPRPGMNSGFGGGPGGPNPRVDAMQGMQQIPQQIGGIGQQIQNPGIQQFGRNFLGNSQPGQGQGRGEGQGMGMGMQRRPMF